MLDDILSACLLRSTQRAGADLLRGTLEVVLEFCVLVGDLKDGRVTEYQASPALDALYASFRKKVSALVSQIVFVNMHDRSIDLTVRFGPWKSLWKGTEKVKVQNSFKPHTLSGRPGFPQGVWMHFGIS